MPRVNRLRILPTYFDEPHEPVVPVVLSDGSFGTKLHSPNVENVSALDFSIQNILSLPAQNFSVAGMDNNFDETSERLSEFIKAVDDEVIVSPDSTVNVQSSTTE